MLAACVNFCNLRNYLARFLSTTQDKSSDCQKANVSITPKHVKGKFYTPTILISRLHTKKFLERTCVAWMFFQWCALLCCSSMCFDTISKSFIRLKAFRSRAKIQICYGFVNFLLDTICEQKIQFNFHFIAMNRWIQWSVLRDEGMKPIRTAKPLLFAFLIISSFSIIRPKKSAKKLFVASSLFELNVMKIIC